MKTELLARVKTAEDEAAAHIQAAEEEARKIVAGARREAEQVVADGRAKADEARQARLDAAREEVAEETTKILANGKRQATNLRKKFESGVDGVTDRAVKIIEGNL